MRRARPDERRNAPGRRRAPARRRAAGRGAADGTSSAAGRRDAGRPRSRPGPETAAETRAAAAASASGPASGRQSKTRWGAPGSSPPPSPRRPRPRRRRTRRSASGPTAHARRARARRARTPRPRTAAPARGAGASARSARARRDARAPARASSSGGGSDPNAVEQSLDDVDLGLRERRVEPDAAHRDAVPARRVDDVAPRRAGDVRVVEHDPTLTRGQLRVERVGEVAQRARALVAVEAAVPAGDVLLGEAASSPPRRCPSRARRPRRASASRRARGRGRPSAARSSAASSRVAAREAETAVSGRRAPGIATTAGDCARSHASATSAGVADRVRATEASASFRASAPARRTPPNGECAMTATPASAHRSTRPPRSARSSTRLSATWTAATGASSSASSSCGRLTFATPTRRTRPSSTSRASARRVVRHGVRGSGAWTRYRSIGSPSSATRLASQSARIVFARPSGTQPPPSRRIPPFVTIRALPAAPHARSARARSRSLWPSSSGPRP